MEAYRRSKLHNDARKVSTAKAVIDYVTDHQDAEAEAEVNPKSRQSYEKFAAQRRRQPFIVLIDGVFFREGPTGIFCMNGVALYLRYH